MVKTLLDGYFHESSNMTTITGVITTFRRPETLRRAIDSVFAQVVMPNELLVIDNADDPETENIVLGYSQIAKIPVRYISETKRGVSAARNRGLKEAAFDYVAFLDDDDIWLPNHLVDFLNLSRNFNDIGLFGGFRARLGEIENIILPDSNILFNEFLLQEGGDVSIRIVQPISYPFYTPSMSESIVEVNRARSILFDEDLLGREDIHFVWRMGKVGNIVLHHKVHGLADQLEISLFSVASNAKSTDRLKMDLKKVSCGVLMLEKVVAENPYSEGMKKARASAYFDSSYVNALAGNTALSIKHFFRSVYPSFEKKHIRLILRIAASVFKVKVK